MRKLLLLLIISTAACDTQPAEKVEGKRERKTTVFSHFKDSIDRAKDISKTQKKY